MRPAKDQRKRELGKIHILASELGMDTTDKDPSSDYRAMLWTVARVRSAANLDAAGRAKVLDHLKRVRGSQSRGAHSSTERSFGRPHNIDSVDRGPLLKKIEHMLASLNRPWAYANGMAKKMFHVDDVSFCNPDQLRRIVAALVYYSKRQQRRAQ